MSTEYRDKLEAHIEHQKVEQEFDMLKWLASFIPEDTENKAGFGPFELPDEAGWMRPIFWYHDHYYVIGPEINMQLSEIDWRIFKALVIGAEQTEDWMERCHRAKHICKYWPIMRSAGHYLYNRRSR